MCAVGGEGVLLFGATLVYSAPGSVWCGVLSPLPPSTPAQFLVLPCNPRLVGEAACDREQQQAGVFTHLLF